MEKETVPQKEILVFSEEECEKIKPLITDFVDNYSQHTDMPVEKWLFNKLTLELPGRPMDEIQKMTDEIINTLHVADQKKESLHKAIIDGQEKESWLAKEIETATSAMTVQQTVQFMNELDSAIASANGSMLDTITTNSGTINMNPNLDGYISEQFHAQSFNLSSVANGKAVYAEVVQTDGVYNANGVDVVIKDPMDPRFPVKARFQLKYGATAEDTIRYIKEGNYRGQQLVVPEEQVEAVKKAFPDRKVSSCIEYDGISSKPLTKADAQTLRDEAQSGHFKDWNWSQYTYNDIAIGIAKQVGAASIMGAAIGAGMDIAEKLYKGEEIKATDVAKKALETGTDFGLKAAISGAIKVGAEKGIIKFIAKGTPAGRIANIVFIGVENAKILYKIAKKDIPPEDGFARMEEITISAAGGLIAMSKGAALGAAWGSVFGPVGTAVGGFVGSVVGYAAGSTVGKKVVQVSRVIREKANLIVKTAAQKIAIARKTVWTTVESVGSKIGKAVSSVKSVIGGWGRSLVSVFGV